MASDSIAAKLAGAKATLAEADKKFPSPPKAPPITQQATHEFAHTPYSIVNKKTGVTTPEDLAAKKQNVDEYLKQYPEGK